MREIQLPIDPIAIRQLAVGEQVGISGVIFTARGEAQRHLYEGGELPFDATGCLMYHCGPIGKKRGKKWTVTAAGPDASAPQENYMGDIIGRLGLRGVIGRGAMGQKSLNACKRFGACYFHTVGGAALALAKCVKEVRAVHLTDKFSGPDAIWELEVEQLPAVITLDSWGRSLHDIVRDVSHRRFLAIHD